MNYKILFFSLLCVFLFFYSIPSVVISDIRDDISSKKPHPVHRRPGFRPGRQDLFRPKDHPGGLFGETAY